MITVGGLVGLPEPVKVIAVTANATAPVNPPVGATLTPGAVVEAPGARVRALGLALRVNPGVAAVAPVTSALIASVWTNSPLGPVPVISTLFAPFAAEELALIVSVAVLVPPATNAVVAGLSAQVIHEAAVHV
jgi:hypothetical protein